MTIFINTVDAKEAFSELINQVDHKNERIIIKRRGKNIAALISIEELNQLEALQDKHDLKLATEALKEARTTGAVTLDELKTKIG